MGDDYIVHVNSSKGTNNMIKMCTLRELLTIVSPSNVNVKYPSCYSVHMCRAWYLVQFIFALYWTLWEWNVLTDTNKIIIIMWCIINKTGPTTAKNLFVFKFTMSNEQAFLTQKRGLLTHSYKKFTRWELSSFPLCIYNAWTALQNRHH